MSALIPPSMKASRTSRLTLLLVLLVGGPALALTTGCLAVAAGAGAAGAVAYVRGELTTTLEASLDHTVKATNDAVQQLQFAKISESKDALQAYITVRNAADKKIKFSIERTSDKLTKLTIRVGVFGDEAQSMTILDKIKANL